MTYILLSPSALEAKNIYSGLQSGRRLRLRNIELICGELGGKEVVAAISGVGKVNTAYTLTLLLEAYPTTELVILYGCGGAYLRSGGAVGDVMIATHEIYADEGVLTGNGWLSMEDIGIPLLKKGGEYYFNSFCLEGEVLHQVRSITNEITDQNVIYGKFLTVSTCSGSIELGNELFKRFQSICENMEGAAAAHIAKAYDVAMIEVRGVSNFVEDRVFENWDIESAVENCSKVVIEILNGL
ncbi:MAG: futalosine hydrolase [Candidatus Syntropharchaeales archaeon]